LAITISVSNILANVAQMIGVPPFGLDTNVTEAQAVSWCRQSLQSLQALNAQKLGSDHHHISSIALRTQAGVNFLTLPSDAIEVFDVLWAKDDETAYRLLPAESPFVLPLLTSPDRWTLPPRFRLEGFSLVFFPTPSEPYEISIWYGQHFGAAATVGGVVQGRLDWQQWLELDLAAKCLTRKRRAADLAEMLQRRDAVSLQMFAPGRARMRAGPSRIQDVEAIEVRRYWEDR
jgi:hypothetical protein